jgi:hypothetical protein
MMTDAELRAALESLPGERVTEDAIKARIAETRFHRIGETVTLCSIHLDNGYSVRGESACVDPANYRAEIGEKLAYQDAFRKLWPLLGFLLAEGRFRRGRVVETGEGPDAPAIAAGWPRYRSHKWIWAKRITRVERGEKGFWLVDLEGGSGKMLDPKTFDQAKPPVPGAYLVAYEDGYVSWSPAPQFEAGNAPA